MRQNNHAICKKMHGFSADDVGTAKTLEEGRQK